MKTKQKFAGCFVLAAVLTMFLLLTSCGEGKSITTEEQILQLINQERTKAGVSTVTLGSEGLNKAAATRAKEQSVILSYTRPSGKKDYSVLGENGIKDIWVGEVLLAGGQNPEEAIKVWMNGEQNRKYLLNKNAKYIGVGHYTGGAYGNYWTVILTYPRGTVEKNFAQEVLDLVNTERTQRGLVPLVMGSEEMCAAAQKRAEELAQITELTHTRPNGSGCFTIFEEYNVPEQATGENAAWGQTTPEEVVECWMNSEGHRANILNENARKLGVGYYFDCNSVGGHNWIQIFGY